MHRCEVKMRYNLDTPDDLLLACGAEANKKMGRIWVCDYHYDIFRFVIDAGQAENCYKVTDSKDAKDDHWDNSIYFEP